MLVSTARSRRSELSVASRRSDCAICFAHRRASLSLYFPCLMLTNLEPPSDRSFPRTEYVCPKCGHFNPSARSLRQGRSSVSPQRQPPSPLPPQSAITPQSAMPVSALPSAKEDAVTQDVPMDSPSCPASKEHPEAAHSDEAEMDVSMDS